MTPTAQSVLPASGALPAPEPKPVLSDEAQLRENLKRCSPETVAAACAFRQTGDLALLPVIVRGVIARYTEPANRGKLAQPDADALHLVEDLALDSLTMMEIVMLAEDVFPISINNDELRGLHTVVDVEHFIAAKVRGEPLPIPPATVASAGCAIASPPCNSPRSTAAGTL